MAQLEQAQAKERKHNPFINSQRGGRALSASQLPLFHLHPPAGYGVLTTIGRKTGKKRARCIRAVRSGERVHIVAIKGATANKGWLQNILANPEVRLRIAGGTHGGQARLLDEPGELNEARRAYCDSIYPFDYLAWINWRHGRPAEAKIKSLVRSWFDNGTPLVVDLQLPRSA